MGHDVIYDVLREALSTIAVVATPFLVAGLTIGVGMAVLQAATQVQEQALSFVPKVIVLGIILMTSGPALLDRLVSFARGSVERIAEVGRGSP